MNFERSTVLWCCASAGAGAGEGGCNGPAASKLAFVGVVNGLPSAVESDFQWPLARGGGSFDRVDAGWFEFARKWAWLRSREWLWSWCMLAPPLGTESEGLWDRDPWSELSDDWAREWLGVCSDEW